MKRILALAVLTVLISGCGTADRLDEVETVQVESIVYPVENGEKNQETVSADETLQDDSETNEDNSEKVDVNPIEEKNLLILADCKDMKIEQTIEAADGAKLLINADVNVDGVTGVSQYEYALVDITEETRANLFEAVFSELAETAEYDELNDVWTLDIDPEIRNYFLYIISYSNGGATIPGEQIAVLENRYYNLYPFEDNRLASLSDSKVDTALDEASAICGQVMASITDTDDYVVDYVQAYGNNGRRPYYKIVFKRMLDGMSVTAYNNWIFLFDNNGIERVTGSLFSTEEIGLEETILSPDEAVRRLQEQADSIDFEEENQMMVTRVTLEYVVITTPTGRILATPVWRFWLGEDDDARSFFGHKILGIDAVTGELIWEERGQTM